MQRRTEVAIIGGGQAGLAMSACLSAAGIDHLVIERGRIGERWRSERWASLRLLTPNWMTRLPRSRVPVAEPGGFMSSTDFVTHLEAYGRQISAPVVYGTAVIWVQPNGAGYRVVTTSGTLDCRAVVIATGACDRPAVPAWSRAVAPGIHQITPDRYRDPDALPAGGVLVVGASATGAQLAREIRTSGRRVVLSVGRHVRAPRRYRGRDLFEWLDASGFLFDPVPADAEMARLRSQPSLQLSGAQNAALGLDRLAAEGVEVAGRAVTGAGRLVRFAGDLEAQCAAAEARRHKLLARIDEHIAQTGLDVPEDRDAWEFARPLPSAPAKLNLDASGVGTIIWATGYRRSYAWLGLPILDRSGEIVQQAGVTPLPGVFVLGLPFQRHRASAFIDGVGRDAEALVAPISRHFETLTSLAA